MLHVDVDIDDGSYKRADISRLLTDDEVKDVVGKLKRVWPFVPAGLGMHSKIIVATFC